MLWQDSDIRRMLINIVSTEPTNWQETAAHDSTCEKMLRELGLLSLEKRIL